MRLTRRITKKPNQIEKIKQDELKWIEKKYDELYRTKSDLKDLN